MVVLRLAGVLTLIAIGAALAMYLFTRDLGYMRFAWRVLQLAAVFIVVFMVFFVLERLVLVA